VLTFYAALHWIDAYLATLDVHPANHGERARHIAGGTLSRVYSQYRRLETRSREARYDLRNFARSEAEALIRHELANIRAEVQRLLN
jgi:hypothetical protein